MKCVVGRVIISVKGYSLVTESSSRLTGTCGDFISVLAALSAGELMHEESEDYLFAEMSFSKDHLVVSCVLECG
jgi:hypothetical protein